MAESYSVTAILSAVDKNFQSSFAKAESTLGSFAGKLSSGLGFGILMSAGSKAFDTITGGIGNMVSGMADSSATWKTFSNNMNVFGQIQGKTSAQIQKDMQADRKVLEDYAAATIYSSSDMASTYSQLKAVIPSTSTSLVTAFGNLASAAENPQQAMRTLSQQATQMVAKPTVAWQDFKLMMEQTPAGVAAVANAMGKSTQELVKDVQDGTVKTSDFFAAMETAGDQFASNAQQFKTLSQAIDGTSESVSSKLVPVFDLFQNVGIKAVTAVGAAFDKLNIDDLVSKIKPFTDAMSTAIDLLSSGDMSGAITAMSAPLDGVISKVSQLGVVAGAAFAVSKTQSFLSSDVYKTAGAGFTKLGATIKAAPQAGMLAFKDFSKTATKSLKSITPSFLKKSVGEMKTNLGDLASYAGSKMSGVTSKFSGIGSAVGKVLPPFKKMGTGVKSAVGSMTGFVGNAFQSMMGLAIKALMPAALIGVVLVGMGLLYQTFGSQIDSILQMVAQKGPEIITNFGNSIVSGTPSLVESGAQMLTGIIDAITANLPALISTGINIITTLVTSVASALPQLIPAGLRMIMTLVTSVIQGLPKILDAGTKLLLGIVQGIVNSLPMLIEMGAECLSGFIQNISENLPTILDTGVQIITSIVKGITDNLPNLLDKGIELVGQFGKTILDNLPTILEAGAQIIVSIGAGILKVVPALFEMIPEIINGIISFITETDWLSVGGKIISGIGNGIKNGIASIFNDGKESGKQVGSGAAAGVTESSGQVTNSMSSLSTAVTSSGFATSASTIGNSFSANLSSALAGVGSTASDAMSGLSSAVSSGGSEAASAATSTGQQIVSGTQSGLNQLQPTAASSMNGFNNALRSGGTQAKSITQQMGSVIVNNLKSKLTQLRSIASTAMNAFNSALTAGRSRAVSIAASTSSGIINAFAGTSSRAYSMGAQIGAGLASGLAASAGAVRSQAASLAAAANAAIQAKAQIHSPSRVQIKNGRYMGEGLQLGILDKIRAVRSAGMRLAQASLMGAGSPTLALDTGSYYGSYGGQVTIEVPLSVDGRKFASATATYVHGALSTIDSRSDRAHGKSDV
jgi:tape measure domain-containing protein